MRTIDALSEIEGKAVMPCSIRIKRKLNLYKMPDDGRLAIKRSPVVDILQWAMDPWASRAGHVEDQPSTPFHYNHPVYAPSQHSVALLEEVERFIDQQIMASLQQNRNYAQITQHGQGKSSHWYFLRHGVKFDHLNVQMIRI